MLGWVKTLGLTREDVNKVEGDVVYHFDGQRILEATIVDEYRAFVAAMRADLRASTGAPTADAYNAADRAARPDQPRRLPDVARLRALRVARRSRRRTSPSTGASWPSSRA